MENNPGYSTGGDVTAWHCQTQVCHEEPSVCPHKEPSLLATEGNPLLSHRDSDPV